MPSFAPMEKSTKPDRETEGTPRWVVIILIGLVGAVLLVLVVMLVGGGGHQRPDHSGMGANGQTESTVTAVRP